MSEPTIPQRPAPAKITPPQTGRHFERPALLRALAGFAASPRKVWVSAPGGAGKTTLVRSFLTADPRPLIWYQVDRGDQDPASLFFYLAQAAAASAPDVQQLPLLTAEYLPNLTAFCRTFFRKFFVQFPAGCVLVFDDLQEGPGAALFGSILAAVMAELPGHSCLFVISREEPYACFARERLNRSLAHLGWEALRLSLDESCAFLRWSHPEDLPAQAGARAYQLTHGWLAGLLLFLGSPAESIPGQDFPLDRTELLFDYFAGETFSRLPGAIRNFLLACAELPTIDATLAERLTGRADAGGILQSLVKGNHFTLRISTVPELFRFHPLFRQFLQSRAEQETDAATLTGIRNLAAQLLLGDGEIEPAAELLIKVRNWAGLTALIGKEAETMLQQGRSQTLLQWLDALPAQLVTGDPWLCYWRGSSLLAIQPATALEALTSAFEHFCERDEALGCMLAWGMAVYAIVVGWSEYAKLDAWIERFDLLRERYPEYPSAEIEALMVQGILKALTWRQPARTDLPAWSERLQQLVMASHNSGFRLLAGSDLVFYHTIVGDLDKARALVGVLDDELHGGQVTPLQSLVWLATRSVLEWIILEREQCLATMEAGRTIIDSSGIHLLDRRLIGQGVTLGLTTGDLPLARQLLTQLPDAPVIASLDHSFLFHLTADLAAAEGDPSRAIALAELAVQTAEEGGSPTPISFSLAGLFLVLLQTGQRERAGEVLQRGLIACRGMNYFSCIFSLLAAHFALENGQQDEALCRLREGFGLAARQGYLNFHPWRDAILARLCREALAAGIEVDHVRRLATVRKLNLNSPDRPALTPKELEVLDWIRQGKTTWEIAKIQEISERTVKFHAANILRKLDATSRSHAVAKALELQLFTP